MGGTCALEAQKPGHTLYKNKTINCVLLRVHYGECTILTGRGQLIAVVLKRHWQLRRKLQDIIHARFQLQDIINKRFKLLQRVKL